MNLKKSLSAYTLQDWIFLIFSVLWVGIVMLDYLNKQVVYIPSITYFKYFNLFAFFGLFGLLLSCYYLRIGFFEKLKKLPVNGLFVFILIMICVVAITVSYNKYWKAPLDYTNYLHLIGKGAFTFGSSLFLVTAAFSMGNLLRTKLLSHKDLNFTFGLVDIALGFAVYSYLLFFLGSIGVLVQFVVLGVLLLMCLLNYEAASIFLKKVLWQPIKKPEDLNIWGGLIAFFIVVYITMNYMYTQAPYPLGFDARNYYVNIPKLIGEAGALIEGFQPYAWSLVMSTGYVAFKSPEVTLFISALGGLLSLFAIYHFSHRYIKISSNYSFLIVLLYLLTPTVTNHFIIEFKVDLSLLFFQVTVLNFLMWWLFYSRTNRMTLLDDKEDMKIIILFGILLGFCLSIKVLSVFLIFGLSVGLWWFSKDIWGAFGISTISIGLILISGLDGLSGLREYHLSPTWTGIVLALVGSMCMIYSFVRQRISFIRNIKILSILGFVSLLTFSPWVYKNYAFTKSTSIINLVMGSKPKPEVKIRRSK